MKRRYSIVSLVLLALAAASLTVACAMPAGDDNPAGEPGTVKVISFGEEIKLADHLVKGKMVIFDFFSEFCPPCRRIAPLLEKLDAKRDDIVVVKIDINRKGIRGIDWESPVAKQFKLEGIPHFKIYNAAGKLEAEGDPAYEKIMALLSSENIK